MMLTFVLMQIDDPITTIIFVAHGNSLSSIVTLAATVIDAQETHIPHVQCRDALLRMLAMHTSLSPGCYVLAPLAPLTYPWTLVIADGDQAFLR